jgi:hypothetical protein
VLASYKVEVIFGVGILIAEFGIVETTLLKGIKAGS